MSKIPQLPRGQPGADRLEQSIQPHVLSSNTAHRKNAIPFPQTVLCDVSQPENAPGATAWPGKIGVGPLSSPQTNVNSSFWSFKLDRGDASEGGRTFNHDIDLNGSGTIGGTVLEANIVEAAGGPRDVNGINGQQDMVPEKMDDDQDDAPFWADDDDNNHGGNAVIEDPANAAEPDEEDSIMSKDWGNPGKNHGTSGKYDD